MGRAVILVFQPSGDFRGEIAACPMMKVTDNQVICRINEPCKCSAKLSCGQVCFYCPARSVDVYVVE